MPGKRKSLNPKILQFALQELDQHLLPDLHYTSEFRRFLNKEIRSLAYLNSEYGFKRFLHVYAIGRTIGAGDECKLKILDLIRKYQFGDQHTDTITTLAEKIQKKGLSSIAAKGGFGLPRSFCSKLLYVYKPDEIIPYDSYVLKSLEIHCDQKVKTIEHYYNLVNEFRATHFAEHSSNVKSLREKYDAHHLDRMNSLTLDPDKLYSWKLTDKYLWCQAFMER